ncbi:hypothetical protein D3C73_1661490 [compost metagenome]
MDRDSSVIDFKIRRILLNQLIPGIGELGIRHPIDLRIGKDEIGEIAGGNHQGKLLVVRRDGHF